MIEQFSIQLSSKPRGFHSVTDEITSQIASLKKIKVGICHILLQHILQV